MVPYMRLPSGPLNPSKSGTPRKLSSRSSPLGIRLGDSAGRQKDTLALRFGRKGLLKNGIGGVIEGLSQKPRIDERRAA